MGSTYLEISFKSKANSIKLLIRIVGFALFMKSVNATLSLEDVFLENWYATNI